MARFAFAGSLAALAFFVVVTAGLQAQQRRVQSPLRTTEDAQQTDDMFLMKAIAAGKLEVDLAKLALQQSNDPQIKQFAQDVIRDHSKLDKQLMEQKGEERGERRPMLDRENRRIMDQFTQLRGPEFDRAYVRQAVKAHEMAVSLFEKEAKSGQNAALKSLAESTLPTLKEHLKSAQDLGRNVQTGTRQR
jgi:putative membrane protein